MFRVLPGPPVPAIGLPLRLRMAATRVCAGFPSPADDYIEAPVDVSALLVGNRAATFLWRVAGECMLDAGIRDGDILVVDRSLDPAHGDIVVAVVQADFAVKRFLRPERRAAPVLANENARMPPFSLPPGVAWEVWGVVTWNLQGHGPARRKR